MIPSSLVSCTEHSLKFLKLTLEEHNGRIPGRTTLRQILGDDVSEVLAWLQALKGSIGSVLGATDVIDAILQTRSATKRPEELFDLIVSGPEVAEVPTCETLTTIHDLIHSAKNEIFISDYAIYGAESIFAHIKSAIESRPDLNVRMVLHVFEDELGRNGRFERFSKDFFENHWQAAKRPDLYGDPRNLNPDFGSRTSMHAKCYIADRSRGLITSANLTDAAHHKNIEAGIVVRYPPMVDRLVCYFEGLISSGYLIKL